MLKELIFGRQFTFIHPIKFNILFNECVYETIIRTELGRFIFHFLRVAFDRGANEQQIGAKDKPSRAEPRTGRSWGLSVPK